MSHTDLQKPPNCARVHTESTGKVVETELFPPISVSAAPAESAELQSVRLFAIPRLSSELSSYTRKHSPLPATNFNIKLRIDEGVCAVRLFVLKGWGLKLYNTPIIKAQRGDGS